MCTQSQMRPITRCSPFDLHKGHAVCYGPLEPATPQRRPTRSAEPQTAKNSTDLPASSRSEAPRQQEMEMKNTVRMQRTAMGFTHGAAREDEARARDGCGISTNASPGRLSTRRSSVTTRSTHGRNRECRRTFLTTSCSISIRPDVMDWGGWAGARRSSFPSSRTR